MVTRCATEGETGPLGLAERYSSVTWWEHVLDLPYSKILARISSHLTFNVVLAVAVCVYQHETHALDTLPVTPLTLCSAALGLLLVFRTSAAYERWQLGLAHTYQLRYHLQQILRVARPWLSERRFARMQRQVRAFPRTIEIHLTARAGAGFIYGVGPRDLITQLSEEIAVKFSKPDVPLAALYAVDRVQGHVAQVLRLVVEMEMLASEAVPRDYSRHTSRFLTVWMCTLPFVLLDCGDVMPVAVAVISWALLSIEEIGHTLEDPFNSPTQPVPVQAILEAGGGEHSLAPGQAAAPPPVVPLWERRVASDMSDEEAVPRSPAEPRWPGLPRFRK